MLENDYLNMINDTSKLLAQEKATNLGTAATAFQKSDNLVNNVEFWKWMGANYPKDLNSTQLIQQAAKEKSRWLLTQLQGKGYEWDYMVSQRNNPLKILSKFDAGDCPTQPGIDITETNLLDSSVKATYQNKAYLSTNNPNLHNTPKDAVVVTNNEKVAYAKKQGYKVNEFMDSEEIQSVRDERFKQAIKGKVSTKYNWKNVMNTSLKAGAISAVIGITVESLVSYRAWKNGEMTTDDYIKEILKAGGDAGITGGATAALMIPVKSAITTAGASTIIGIPIAIVLSSAVNKVVAPCFSRGEYKKILNEAKYYQSIENFYDDFLFTIETSADMFSSYVNQMIVQENKFNQIKKESENIDRSLENLYNSI